MLERVVVDCAHGVQYTERGSGDHFGFVLLVNMSACPRFSALTDPEHIISCVVTVAIVGLQQLQMSVSDLV